MKKKPKATTSQYSYMVTGLLSAKVQQCGTITQDDVKEAVTTAKLAYELIAELIGEDEEKPSEPKLPEPMPDYFVGYPWTYENRTATATWTELANWLKSQGVTSNRKISKIFKESIEKGYIIRNEITHKYQRPEPSPF